jgi:hypothetical protein
VVLEQRRPSGYNGVTVWNPEAELIGRIRLPEVAANVCFGGPKRNWLFAAASQSFYAFYVNTQGHPGLTSGRRQVRVSLLPILKRGFLLSSETKERILVVDLTLALNRLIQGLRRPNRTQFARNPGFRPMKAGLAQRDRMRSDPAPPPAKIADL